MMYDHSTRLMYQPLMSNLLFHLLIEVCHLRVMQKIAMRRQGQSS